MSAQTQVYFFNQRQQVVLLDAGLTSSARRYSIVYAKELNLIKGVDNLLEFAFINTEQKPVNLTGKTVTARILSADNRTVLLQKTLGTIYPITGLMKLEVAPTDLEGIDIQKAHYTLSVSDSTTEYPAFVDAQGASRGTINIVNGIMPDFTPSLSVTIPSHPPVVTIGTPVTYRSSAIATLDQSSFTVQVTFDSFTGSVQLVGSPTADFSLQYDISDQLIYSGYTGSDGFVVDGYHPYVQFIIINEDVVGDVTEILYR